MNDEPKALLSAFSFLGTLFSFFITGFLLLAFNGPLIALCLVGWQCDDKAGLLHTLHCFWKQSLEGTGLSMVLLYCLVALLVGFCVQPVALRLVFWMGRLVSRLGAKKYGHEELYDTAGKDEKYAILTDWLHRNPAAKRAWEWEFINYYLACGIFLNAFVALLFLWKCIFFWDFVVLVPWAYLLIHALERSRVQRKMYNYYVSIASADPRPTKK